MKRFFKNLIVLFSAFAMVCCLFSCANNSKSSNLESDVYILNFGDYMSEEAIQILLDKWIADGEYPEGTTWEQVLADLYQEYQEILLDNSEWFINPNDSKLMKLKINEYIPQIDEEGNEQNIYFGLILPLVLMCTENEVDIDIGEAMDLYLSCIKQYTSTPDDPDEPHTHSYTNYVYNSDATCQADGTETALCDNGCGTQDTRIAEGTMLDHTPGEAVTEKEVAASCDNAGSYDVVVYCTDCGEEINRETVTVNALGHVDTNNDGKCDTCGEKMTGNDQCPQCGKNHNQNFFTKLVGFFHTIFYRLTHLFKR